MKLIQGKPEGVAVEKMGGAYAEHTANFLPGILESSNDLFAAVDTELRLVAFNSAFRHGIAEMVGAAPQLDQGLGDVLAGFPTISGTVAELCRRAFTGEAVRLPLEFVAQNGQRSFFNATFSPISDPAGVVVVVGVALRDVTDKRVTEQKLQGVLEATPDAILVVHEGVIEFANTQLEKMFGYGRGGLVGASLERLVPERLRERHAFQRVGFERHPKTRPMGAGLKLQGLKADGSEFPVEISLSPLEISGQDLVIAAVRDITVRKQMEDELRRESSALRRELASLQRRQDVPSELEVYRVGFEKAAAALFHYCIDGRIKRVNERFCQLLGYSREELLQTTIQKITHPDDVQVNTELDIKLQAGALENYRVDKRVLRKDQETVWVRLAVSIQRSTSGEPDYMIAVAEDITERKRTEVMLREAQLRLAMTAEIARVGYAELDLETKRIYFSPEFQRQLGFEDAELPNTYGEWSRRLHPEDRERTTNAMQSLVIAPKNGIDLEYRLFHKDGSYHWFLARGLALEDLPGHANKLLFTQIDISERKATEKRLREQAEELHLALRVGRSGSFQWNAQTGEHYWSDEIFSLYGLKPEEFGGRDPDWLACLLPEDRDCAMAAMKRALTTGEYAVGFRIRRQNDGEIRWISARGQVFFDEGGIPKYMAGINVDVTEQRQIQSELEQSKARLEAVLDSLKEGVVIFDLDGNIVDVNPAALELMRCARPEDARVQVRDLTDTFELVSLDGRILEVEEWPLMRVLRGESFTDCELVVRRRDDGGAVITSHNGAPVRGINGEMILGVLTLEDVGDRKRAERALQESERRLALALKASQSAVWEVDVATRRLFPADALLFTMVGYNPGELATLDEWAARIHDEDRARVLQTLDDVVQGKQDSYYGVEMRYQARDGTWRWILCQCTAAERDQQGKAIRLIGTHTDVSARKFAEERAREAVQHDPLTGLPNRALVYEYGGHLLAAARRSHGHVALLFIDLDRFKPINDQYGHEVGDQVLQEVGKRLVECIRDEDLVGRLGGDEFVIILPHLDVGRHHAAVVAQKIIENINRPFQIGTQEFSISSSVGISYFPEHSNTVEELIRTSDLAMYHAKQSGRANYQTYTDALDHKANEAYTLEIRLRDALKCGTLELHYQPVIDVKSGKLIGAEALARLPSDGEKAPGPSRFIPVAESSGLIGELGEWVAAEACRQHEAWRKDGMPLPIAINVSPLQFRQRSFPEKLSSIIADAGIDPAGLELEVTESAVMESIDDAVEILGRIKSLGVKVALDDFGTGYSSLNRLSRLPFDKLKVDQSFLRDIERDSASRAITEAIIALGRNLKLEVVGEGIESENAMHYLEEHGCDHAQGFWFSEPLPATEFAQWYRKRAAVQTALSVGPS